MLIQRLKVVIPVIAVLCLCFFLPLAWGRALFLLVAALMFFLGCDEAFNLLNPPQKGALKTIAALYGLFMIVLAWALSSFWRHGDHLVIQFLLAPLLLTAAIGAVFCVGFRRSPDMQQVQALLASAGLIILIPWSLSAIPKFFFMSKFADADPRPLLFFMMLVTKIADTGAFAAGSWTAKRPGGNHKLSPLVSPKKSWEGLVGGTLASVLTGVICYFVFPATVSLGSFKMFTLAEVILFGILASIVGLLGDLAESALKRAANVKDSGKLPGIGGILDMLDSLIFVSPIFYYWILIKIVIH